MAQPPGRRSPTGCHCPSPGIAGSARGVIGAGCGSGAVVDAVVVLVVVVEVDVVVMDGASETGAGLRASDGRGRPPQLTRVQMRVRHRLMTTAGPTNGR